MSVEINWPEFFDDSLKTDIMQRLNDALSKSADASDMLVDPLQCVGLEFGDLAPELGVSEIADCTEKSVRVSFSFEYKGNASIALLTKVQGNAHSPPRPLLSRAHERLGIIMANKPYVLPLRVELGGLRVEGKVDVELHTESKEVSVILKSNPLHDFVLNSNFDVLPAAGNSVRDAVKKEIEDGINLLLSKPQTFNM